MKKVCVYIGGRANYSSSKSILRHIANHNELELQILVGTAAVLDRYNRLDLLIEKDGFDISYKFFSMVEGETPITMTKTTGLSLIEATTALGQLSPDIVLVVGDRYDVLPIGIAAVFMNIKLAHTMGGEVTGTIDESVRHALTKLAHFHFPATEEARQRIIRMGEADESVFNVGCPRNDLVLEQIDNVDSLGFLKDIYKRSGGVGPELALDKGFLLVSQHPVTTEYNQNRKNMELTLTALESIAMRTVLIWPNSDAGSDEVSTAIRSFRERKNPDWLHVFKDLPVETYIHLMNSTLCLVGNSSSGIREGALLGTPVVNIGTRQASRQKGKNVVSVANSVDAIKAAILKQVRHGRYEMDPIYGDGSAGDQIAKVLADYNPPLQKRITY